MEHIERLYGLFTEFLEKKPFEGKPSKLYEAKNYILGIGGKRARPIALLAAYEAFDKEVKNGLNAAWAFEVFHNFTLTHDDIMDNASMRRGKKALHTQYDIPTAILAGDNMQLYVIKHLMKHEPKLAHELITLITQTGIEICEGQYMDMDFESRSNVPESEYIEMIRLKTAVLLGACFKAGGMIAGAGKEKAELLYQMGVELGLGFQIMDDLLDAFSTNPKVGKVQGGDIIANKKTILWIQALKDANAQQKENLQNWVEQKEFVASEKVADILSIFKELRVEESITTKMNEHYSKASLIFDELEISKESALYQFMQFISQRKH